MICSEIMSFKGHHYVVIFVYDLSPCWYHICKHFTGSLKTLYPENIMQIPKSVSNKVHCSTQWCSLSLLNAQCHFCYWSPWPWNQFHILLWLWLWGLPTHSTFALTSSVFSILSLSLFEICWVWARWLWGLDRDCFWFLSGCIWWIWDWWWFYLLALIAQLGECKTEGSKQVSRYDEAPSSIHGQSIEKRFAVWPC